MYRFIGPIQSLVGFVEPKISDMAVNRHNSNIYHHHQQNSNFILTYSQYTNLAIFMILFMLCAIEVIFVKIVTAINIDDNSIDIDGETYPLVDMDLLNNNSLNEIDQEVLQQQHQQQQRHQQQRSVVAHLISTQTFLQRITQTAAYDDINNNNNNIMINSNSNANAIL